MSATAKQIKTIDDAFASVPEIYRGWQNLRDKLVQTSLESEKRHRDGRGVRGFSSVKAARYFAVKWLLDALRATKPLTVADYLSTRDDAYLAAAIVEAHRARFVGFVNQPWVEAFDALDYVELMEDHPREVVTA